MRLTTAGLLVVVALAIFVTAFFISYFFSPPPDHGTAFGQIANQVVKTLALPVTALSWGLAWLALTVDRNGRNAIRKAGVDDGVYDIMVKMRGAGSRLTLLRSMNTPKHRSELAQITGLDWKEVDRDIELLEKYGLVSIYAESGTIKMYGLTQQGKLLCELLSEMTGVVGAQKGAEPTE